MKAALYVLGFIVASAAIGAAAAYPTQLRAGVLWVLATAVAFLVLYGVLWLLTRGLDKHYIDGMPR